MHLKILFCLQGPHPIFYYLMFIVKDVCQACIHPSIKLFSNRLLSKRHFAISARFIMIFFEKRTFSPQSKNALVISVMRFFLTEVGRSCISMHD